MGHILSSSIFCHYNRIPETKFLLNLYLFKQERYLGCDSGQMFKAGTSRKGSRAAPQPRKWGCAAGTHVRMRSWFTQDRA